MFTELDHSLVRQRNEELMHEARKWHLQSKLRTNRENRLGTRPQKETGLGHEGPRSGSLGTTVELVQRYAALRRTRMKGIYMKEINRKALGGAKWVGKGALLCLGLLAMSVLTAVMLTATALPGPAVRRRRDLRGRRETTNTSQNSAPRRRRWLRKGTAGTVKIKRLGIELIGKHEK